jgi:hypothetical protein
MSKFYMYIHWVGVIIIAALALMFVFKPHYLGIAENPNIKLMRHEILILGRTFKDERAKELQFTHGCNFWTYQLQAFDTNLKIREFLIATNMQAKEDSMRFIKNYATTKTSLISKHEALSKPGELALLKFARQLEVESLDRDLETHNKYINYLPALIENGNADKAKLQTDRAIVISMIILCEAEKSSTLAPSLSRVTAK